MSAQATGGRGMRFGVHVPQWGPAATRHDVLAVARAAEDAGFDSVWTSDHLVWPARFDSAYPFADAPPVDPTAGFLEPLTQLAVVAGATERVRLGVGTLIAPLRHPLAIAKTVASLDVLSDGRSMLALGVGWLREEFAALDMPFEQRGRRLEEAVGIMREAWRTGRVERAEGLYRFAEVYCMPTPAQPGGPPLWIGGMGDRALERVGRIADGWYAIGARAEVVAQGRATVARAAEQAGRDPAAVEIATVVGFHRDEDELARRLRGLADAGVRTVVFGAFGSSSGPLCEAIRRFGERLLPSFGEPGA